MKKRWIVYLCASLTLAALLAVNIVQTVPLKEARASALPRPTSYNLGRPGGQTYYDEQIACSFTQNVPSLSYTIMANSQSGTDGYGPAYLVNGLGSTGYWYQVGLSYNWAIGSGFQLNYEVFDPRQNSIFPSNGGGGLAPFSPVNPGDTIVLSLTFAGGNVVMLGTDQTTGASSQETFSAEGATTFVGTPSAVSTQAGYWTGLMTEWYHTAPYSGGEQSVTYTDNGAPITSAWIWMEELTVTQSGISGYLFSAQTPSPFTFTNPSQFQSFTSNGATASIDATQFVTGGTATTPPPPVTSTTIALSFDYSITGGAGASSAPVLTYVTGGSQKTATLTQTSQTFTADTGTAWSVTNPLTSSTSSERWQTSQTTSGTAASSQTTTFVYYHQYLVTFNFTVGGGGTGYSSPAATCQQFGSPISSAMGAQTWADAAAYSFPSPLLGSSSSERWTTDTASGAVSASGSIIAAYTHQFYVTINLTPASGGSVSAASGWFDSGAAFQPTASSSDGWQFEGWTGSGQGSYSGASLTASAVVNDPLSETATFYPGLTINPSGGGSVAYSAGATTGSIQSLGDRILPRGNKRHADG